MKTTKFLMLVFTLKFVLGSPMAFAAAAVSPAYWSAVRQAPPLRGSFAEVTDQFGIAIAASEDTIVVGANWDDSEARGINGDGANNDAFNSGAAYVFVRAGSNWVQQAYLKPSNTEVNDPTGDNFGWSVAISADTIVVGSFGEDSAATRVDGDQFDNNAPGAGAAYVFVRTGTNWTQQAYLKASNSQADDAFGHDVAISGDTIIVSAHREDGGLPAGGEPNEDITDSGAAYIFIRNGTTWTQQAYLKPANPDFGDMFGHSVDISGDIAIVSARREDSDSQEVNADAENNDAIDSGAAYVFVRNGSYWTQEAYLKASNAEAADEFGMEVAVSGNTAVVGARFEDSSATGVNGSQNNGSPNSGAAYIFVRRDSSWVQQAYLKASNTGPGDLFGKTVSIHGDTALIGANFEDSSSVDGLDESLPDSGASYLFVRNGTNWSQKTFLKASNRAGGNRFGYSVAISGRSLAVSSLVGSPQGYAFRGDAAQPRLTLSVDERGNALSFPGQVGVTYHLQRAASLPALWETIATIDASESRTLEYSDADSTPEKAFYRLSLP